jgi:hypothetical protein
MATKNIYTMTDQEILEELFSGMTPQEVVAYIDKVYSHSRLLTPDILRNGGLI